MKRPVQDNATTYEPSSGRQYNRRGKMNRSRTQTLFIHDLSINIHSSSQEFEIQIIAFVQKMIPSSRNTNNRLCAEEDT